MLLLLRVVLMARILVVPVLKGAYHVVWMVKKCIILIWPHTGHLRIILI